VSGEIKFAVIGGSRGYDLLARHSFGEEADSFELDSPFGKSGIIHSFGGKTPFYFLSRHGDFGYDITAPFVNYRANIWALKLLGVERIISWSQPGSLVPARAPGSFCVPDDIIDQTRNRASTFYKNTGLGFIRLGEPFCPEIRKSLNDTLSSAGADFRKSGVYCCTEGPRLETPAEVKMFRKMGADMVGMTLAPEAFLARELEICYASVCMMSNFAEGIKKRPFRKGELFEGMLTERERAKVASSFELFPEIINGALGGLAGMKRDCDCGKAMERYRKAGKVGDDLLDDIRSFGE